MPNSSSRVWIRISHFWSVVARATSNARTARSRRHRGGLFNDDSKIAPDLIVQNSDHHVTTPAHSHWSMVATPPLAVSRFSIRIRPAHENAIPRYDILRIISHTRGTVLSDIAARLGYNA